MSKAANPQWTASFANCVIELVPAAHTRTFVMVSGWLTLLLGLAIITHLHTLVIIKVILAAAWIADTLRELARQGRGHARVRRLRLEPRGRMTSLDVAGRTQTLRILDGSVVLRRCASLRLGFDDGLNYVELFLSRDFPAPTWRRLQVICRHSL